MSASGSASIRTVAFEGIEVKPVDVQVQIGAGLPSFAVVGLPDKAIAESRERVRSALGALGLALPPKRITVNLAPADLRKEGSHYDLPIALGLLVAMGVLPQDLTTNAIALGELGLDGSLRRVDGVLPTAVAAAAERCRLVCPAACGGEAAWLGGEIGIVAADSLLDLIQHERGERPLPVPSAETVPDDRAYPDLRDVKGQETAKRVLEIAAAGGHNLLMSGPPGSGKSMLAARLPGLLPPLDTAEILEVSMIASIAGTLDKGRLTRRRPFREPHHATSVAALVGGGPQARPGEISLAHKGILFLDELPEFARPVLEGLRQPMETGRVTVTRAQVKATYPSRFQLVAAMNPCPCGMLGDPARACAKAPRCGESYQSRLSGPLLDRIDLHIDVPAVSPADLAMPPPAEGSEVIAKRVAQARAIQAERYLQPSGGRLRTNAEVEGERLDAHATPDADGRTLLQRAAERQHLSARGYHRVLRVARTIADLDGEATVRRRHVAEALTYRRRERTRP
ncbi:YifB family Mg chelatase-like AAA ATPase [Marinivivus vitaminiproducens]|uniref:YifB family Mg chelatase-like AAA ATPase n=1 Tax=Marinivivus vitaminiproducens TaxID=3035935 RepID=UPI0027A92F17|nr:YifB family Mg chelatase-like AAA ATPase [Geminicoccaceae bacterium SCSIO 64248]